MLVVFCAADKALLVWVDGLLVVTRILGGRQKERKRADPVRWVAPEIVMAVGLMGWCKFSTQ